MSKRVLVFIIVLLVGGGLGAFYLSRRERGLEVETATVSQSDIRIIVSASGKVRSANQADIFAKTSGTVWGLPVVDGQQVSQGDLLLQLDATAAQATNASKELALETARQKKKDLEDSAYTSADLQAAEALVNEKYFAWLMAEEDYNEDKTDESKKETRDTAYTLYLQAEEALEDLRRSNPSDQDWVKVDAEIASARKALLDAKLTLSHTTVTAPQDGTLLYYDGGSGKLDTTSVVTSGQKLFIIADLEDIQFEAEVDEADIGKIEVGQKVRLDLDAYPGREFSGAVSEIERIVSLDSAGNKVVKVKIRIQAADEPGFKLGLSGDADIIIEEKKGVLTVPLEAVSGEGGKDYVSVWDGKKALRRPVELGLESDDVVEVLSGLQTGEDVVISGLEGR